MGCWHPRQWLYPLPNNTALPLNPLFSLRKLSDPEYKHLDLNYTTSVNQQICCDPKHSSSFKNLEDFPAWVFLSCDFLSHCIKDLYTYHVMWMYFLA